MAIASVQVKGNDMLRKGTWFTTWIITDSAAPALVCLAAFKGVHVETLIAESKSQFPTLPGKPAGVLLTGFCKSDVPSTCTVSVNIEQEGMRRLDPTKPND